jgi:hypothetical protein
LSVEIPNLGFGTICKVCNLNLRAIINFTDTSAKEVGFAVKVARTVWNLRDGERFGFAVTPGIFVVYNIIDFLTKR